MTTETTIRQSLLSQLSDFRDNIIILDNADKLELNKIVDGVLIVYSIWSGPAIANSIQAIKILYDSKYPGKIIVVDIDGITPDLQISLFGQVCNGWGEIFIIHHGKIVEKYFGKNSFTEFKIDYENNM